MSKPLGPTLPSRPLGRTGHASSVLAFGGAAVGDGNEERARDAVRLAIRSGINHFDVAPMYGEAESTLGAVLGDHRKDVFLACKTRERKRFRAEAELERSLSRLRVESFDLYQAHSIGGRLDLDQLLSPKGALGLMEEARKDGTIRFIGITGHHCEMLRQAIEEFPFDTVMFPLNPLQLSLGDPASNYRPLIAAARKRGVGTIGIKAVARRPWPNGQPRTHTTWYEPWTDPDAVKRCLSFALSHDLATTVLPSDTRLWPTIIEAASALEEMSDSEIHNCADSWQESTPLYVQEVIPARQAWQG